MIPSKWFSVALKMEGLCFHCWKHLYNLPPAAAISPQPQPLMRSAERQPLVPVRLERSLQRKSIHVVSQLHSRRNPTPPRPLRRAHRCCRGLRRIAISHVHLKKKKNKQNTHIHTHTAKWIHGQELSADRCPLQVWWVIPFFFFFKIKLQYWGKCFFFSIVFFFFFFGWKRSCY